MSSRGGRKEGKRKLPLTWNRPNNNEGEEKNSVGTKREKERKEKKKEKKKKKKEKSRKWENMTCGMEESGGKFPLLLINSVDENQGGRKKKKNKEHMLEH